MKETGLDERGDDFNEEISVPRCTASLHVYTKEKHCVPARQIRSTQHQKFIWNRVLSVALERQKNRETRRGKTGRTKWPRCIRLSAAVHTGAPRSSSSMFLTPTVMQPRRAAELSQHRHGFPISSLTNRHAQLYTDAHWGMKLNAVHATQSCKGERRFMLGQIFDINRHTSGDLFHRLSLRAEKLLKAELFKSFFFLW